MTTGVSPELSVAVGSVHDTMVEVVPPKATFWVIGPGHPLMTGGMVSTVVTACVNNCRHLDHQNIFVNNQLKLVSMFFLSFFVINDLFTVYPYSHFFDF